MLTLEKLTECNCTEPGWCQRHLTIKDERAFRICGRSVLAFANWDWAAKNIISATSLEEQAVLEQPGILTLGSRFLAAALRFAAAGCPTVPQEVKEARLSVCKDCQYCDHTTMVCRHQSCGCQLARKTSWSTESCPDGQWHAFQQNDQSKA